MTSRRIIKEFRLDEISAVVKPAQAGARVVLMKSAERPRSESRNDGRDLDRRLVNLGYVAEADGSYSLPYEKAAAAAHDEINAIAKSTRQAGETEAAAYDRALSSPEGRAAYDKAEHARRRDAAREAVATVTASLDELVTKRMRDHSEPRPVAMTRVLETTEGRAAYQRAYG